MLDPEFDLKELCARGDVTPRTVHYYVQQGLLPPAGAPGPGARYGERHLWRLRLIKLLQAELLPLAEIARRMKELPDAQVKAIVQREWLRRDRKQESALEYIRGVLGGDQSLRGLTKPPPSMPYKPVVPADQRAWLLEKDAGTTSDRSNWDRFTLADGVELHVRRPQARFQQRDVARLLEEARRIFRSDRREE